MKKTLTWYCILHLEKKKYFQNLITLVNKKRLTKLIYPKKKEVFKAFLLTEFYTIKVVILGQDPYYDKNKADGLAFSVPYNVKKPPSLENIFKELKTNFPEYSIPKHGCLENWAKQGVFLINTILTVEHGKPGSHSKLGWTFFTNKVISSISKYLKGVVFLLWGKYAQEKEHLIDVQKHYVLRAAHPSPLSAYRGFFGCRHFLLVNKILINQKKNPIKW